MSFEVLKQNDRLYSHIADPWREWMRHSHEFYMRFVLMLGGNSPLKHHKSTCAGFFANSAALAGYLPVLDVGLLGPFWPDSHYSGKFKADFCFYSGEHFFAFKVRRAGRPTGLAYLERQLHHALDRLTPNSSAGAAGCLAIVVEDSKGIKCCEDFVHSDLVDFAYRIGPLNEPAFVFFRLKV